ncbi:Macrolide-specific efflux protein MacA [Marinobacterium lacunae]|uniref:Macrolide-specific efflux protein MacA n=1 Tax=Marinobacterium lacunae TaxID=1232683 RepID=A0A081G233_9GAMM|nr:efflux RND transporter periplasmic adaptor subunit [Marinobacterium lacunae]KEA64838.1 Macrolide-specific efflux protein MacA [Marinobacterium lacunae]
MKKPIKHSLLALSTLVIAGALYAAYDHFTTAPAPSYVTEPVRHGTIEETVLATGMLQASKLVSVGAQVSGQIQTLPVALGQTVKKGDLIAQIDSLSQQNSLREAQASLKSIDAQIRAKKAQIEQAHLEFNRQKKMQAVDASARSDYETADANLRVYRAELEQLQAEREQAVVKVDSAKVELGYTKITAPMDGTVVYTAVEEGQTVNANQSTPTIVEMARLDRMTIKAQISEADVVNVKAGQPVYFTILGQPQTRYEGTLRAVEPGPTSMDGDDSDMTPSDSDAIYYNGLFDVNNPDGTLRIGMTAEVSIVLAKSENALLVPAQILQKGMPEPPTGAGSSISPAHATVANSPDTGYQVPVLSEGRVEYRPVQVGINNKFFAEITSGLNEGDQVVTGMSSGDGNLFQPPRGPMGF